MIFNSQEFGEIRTTEIDNKPYFCGTMWLRHWDMQSQEML